MTAEPVGDAVWSPNPVKQRHAGYTIEDVLRLPDGAPRVELDNGVAHVVPSPTLGHQDIGNLLWWWLRQHAPAAFRPATDVGVIVGRDETLESDVLLLRRPVVEDHHYFPPDQVVIAVEVVSPSTKRRDRLQKPNKLAAAGVPHYWRVEQNPIHVFAYDLVDGHYVLAADAEAELLLSAPFEIKLPIREITP